MNASDRSERRSVLWCGLLALAFLLLYVLTVPENHSEAEDAYAYARQIETLPIVDMVHPHHVIYGPVVGLLFRGLTTLGILSRSFPLMIAISIVCGVVCLLAMACMGERRLHLSRVSSIAAACGLGFSYGFWRYACEAELYVPACLFCLLVLFGGMGPIRSRQDAITGGALGGLAVLVHVLIAPMVLAVIVARAAQRQWRLALVYCLFAGTVIGCGYGIAYACGAGSPRGNASTASVALPALPSIGKLGPAALVKGTVAFSQTLVSGNFLFAYSGTQTRLSSLFPSRNFSEEMHMGRESPAVSAWLPMCLLCALLILGIWCFVARFRCSRQHATRRPVGDLKRRDLWAVWLSLVLYACAMLVFEPGNPELWVLASVPLWMLLGHAVIGPLVAHGRIRLVVAVLLLFGATNYVGGMLLVSDEDGDYNSAKAAWVVREAVEGDVVVTSDSMVFVRYLRYHTKANVVSLYSRASENRDWGETDALAVTGAVYVLGDVLCPPDYIKARNTNLYVRLSRMGESIAPDLRSVHSTPFGPIYMWAGKH